MLNANVTDEKLGRLRPAEGGVAAPVPHEDALLYLKRTLRLFGMEDGRAEVGVTQDRLDMVCIVYAGGHDLALGAGRELWFGLVNANSRLRRSRMYAGVSVKGVPVAMARSPAMHKHTVAFHIPKETHDALQELTAEALHFPRRLERLAAKPYSPGQCDRLFLKVSRADMIAWTKVKRLYKEKGKIAKNRDASALDLCLAFAKATEKRPAITYGPRRDRLQDLFAFYETVADKEG